MLKQEVNITDSDLYIYGGEIYKNSIFDYFHQKGFSSIRLTDRTNSAEFLKEIQTDKSRISCLLYFIEDITEVKSIQKVAAFDNCGVLPIVSAGNTEITLLLLQKTNIKNVEHLPLNFETLFVKIEKMLIRLHMHSRLIESNRENREFFLRILRVMAKLLEERDQYTEHHSENVAKIACAIAQRFEYSKKDLNKLEMAGLLHDFGKIGISDQILNKPGGLTAEEFEKIKMHPSIAQAILEPVHNLEEIIPWIKYHHEKFDGSGYPEGIEGENIPFPARILKVADSYEAMQAKRSYHDPYDDKYILNELVTNKGRDFDPEIVDIFLEVLKEEELDLIK